MPAEQRRAGLFALSKLKPSVVMLGDSITEEANWNELTGCPTVVNRGIGGNTTRDILARLNDVIVTRPRAVLVLAGAVDVATDVPVSETVANMSEILKQIEKSGSVPILLLPLPARQAGRDGLTNKNLERIADEYRKLPGTKIDLRSKLQDENGFLRLDLSYNNLHLNPMGYAVMRDGISETIAQFCHP